MRRGKIGREWGNVATPKRAYVMSTLARPEDYVCGMLRNLYDCKREHGLAYATRLKWRDLDDDHSELLLTKPERVIAVVLRGNAESGLSRKSLPRRRCLTANQ